MVPQIPQLRKPDAAQIDNVIALANRRLRVFSIRDGRAQWQDESTQVLIQREQLQHLPGHFRVGGEFPAVFAVGVHAHRLRIDLGDFVDVEGDAAFVSSTRPLRVQAARLLVLVDVDRFVQLV